jgi:hypothetical protein
MARKQSSAKSSRGQDTGKVGSDPDAVHKVGGKGDFGHPVVPQSVERINEDDPIERPAGSAIGTGDDLGRRTVGVGARGGGDGNSSGGDLDTDFVGVAGGAGLTQSAGGSVTTGPASTDGSSDEFAGPGGHAKGENALPRGQIGGGMKVRGTTSSPPDARTGRAGASDEMVDPQDTE